MRNRESVSARLRFHLPLPSPASFSAPFHAIRFSPSVGAPRSTYSFSSSPLRRRRRFRRSRRAVNFHDFLSWRVMTYRSRFEPHRSRLLGNRKDRWVFSVLWWAMNLRWIEIGTGGERERVIERVNLIESLDKSLQYLANWRSTLGHSCKIYTNGACGTNERTLFS